MAGAEAKWAASPVCCCPPKTNLIPPQESTTFQQHGGPQSSVPEASLKHNTKKSRTWDMSSRLWYRGSAGTPGAHSTAAHSPSGCLNTSCQSQSSKPGGALTPLPSYLYFQWIFCHGKGFCAAEIHVDTRNHLGGGSAVWHSLLTASTNQL